MSLRHLGSRFCSVVIRLDHVVTQVLEAAEPFVTNFAGQNRIDMILIWLLLGVWIFPRRDLIMRYDLLVMLSFLHVFSQ